MCLCEQGLKGKLLKIDKRWGHYSVLRSSRQSSKVLTIKGVPCITEISFSFSVSVSFNYHSVLNTFQNKL